MMVACQSTVQLSSGSRSLSGLQQAGPRASSSVPTVCSKATLGSGEIDMINTSSNDTFLHFRPHAPRRPKDPPKGSQKHPKECHGVPFCIDVINLSSRMLDFFSYPAPQSRDR